MSDNVQKPIGKDFSGYEVLTEAVKALLNQFPGLEDGEQIGFENLGRDSGIAFSADSGAVILEQREDICGGVYQKCRYPFFVVYRSQSAAGEKQKIKVQRFLDSLGKWLCGEPVRDSTQEYRLESYPPLKPGREIKRITRDNFYGLVPEESGAQDWVLPVVVEYENEFER